MVLGPLCWVQQPPLFPAEIHSHVQKGHWFLQCHTMLRRVRELSKGTEDRLATTFGQLVVLGYLCFGGVLETLTGAIRGPMGLFSQNKSVAQSGERVPTSLRAASVTGTLPPPDPHQYPGHLSTQLPIGDGPPGHSPAPCGASGAAWGWGSHPGGHDQYFLRS